MTNTVRNGFSTLNRLLGKKNKNRKSIFTVIFIIIFLLPINAIKRSHLFSSQ